MLLSIAFKVQYALYQFMHFLGIKPMTLALFEPRFPGNAWTVVLDCVLLNTWGKNGALFANVLYNIQIFCTFSGNQTHDFGVIHTKIPRKCMNCWAEILFSWTHGMKTALFANVFCNSPLFCTFYGHQTHWSYQFQDHGFDSQKMHELLRKCFWKEIVFTKASYSSYVCIHLLCKFRDKHWMEMARYA